MELTYYTQTDVDDEIEETVDVDDSEVVEYLSDDFDSFVRYNVFMNDYTIKKWYGDNINTEDESVIEALEEKFEITDDMYNEFICDFINMCYECNEYYDELVDYFVAR